MNFSHLLLKKIHFHYFKPLIILLIFKIYFYYKTLFNYMNLKLNSELKEMSRYRAER